jgi:serine/threonine protein phosphatase PrpC
MEKLLDTLLAKDTREGIGCDNMTAIIVTFK